MSKPTNRETSTIRIDPGLKEVARIRAVQERRTFSDLVEDSLKLYLMLDIQEQHHGFSETATTHGTTLQASCAGMS